MYYKKRPELMKLVEEFYRAYRALAERYDYATGELRHAQRTLQAAFPNQEPLGLPDDLPEGHRMLLEGKSNKTDFEGIDEKDEREFRDFGDVILSESERADKAECEVENLKKELADILAEKESILAQYQESLERFSNADRELIHALEKSRILEEKAMESEKEVRMLKETLRVLQVEKDTGLSKQMEYLETISDLEEKLELAKVEAKGTDNRAFELMNKLSILESENDKGLLQYGKCLDKISVLEKKISVTESDAKMFSEQASKAELEVEKLKKDLFKITEEKEALRVLYSECLEKSYNLELDLSSAQDDVQRLTNEILTSMGKIRSVEEICVRLENSNRSLKMEASELAKKIMSKDRELCEKHEELEKLRNSAKDEHSNYLQVEAALQTLESLYTRSQEEQRSLATELKNSLKMLKDLDICRSDLEEEMKQIKNENSILNQEKVSSEVSIRNSEVEIIELKKIKERLEEEVALQSGQCLEMQKEMIDLKYEITGLNTSYKALMSQLESVGLNPESIGLSVKDLKDENIRLRLICEKDRDEENMKKKLTEKNAALEISLTDITNELEGSRKKVEELENSFEFLHGEKTALLLEKTILLSQLHVITVNMQKLMDQSNVLENSLSSVNLELENLREKSKNLEVLCDLLNTEKSNLVTERSFVISQLESVQKRLETLENRFTQFEERYGLLEKEKETGRVQIQELISSLTIEKQERESFMALNQARIDELENQVHHLHEDSKSRKEEFQEELDKAVMAQFENFMLHKFIKDVEEKNYALSVENEKHLEASKLADKLISELETEILEQQVEEELLLVEVENLRLGIYQVFLSLEMGLNGFSDGSEPTKISVEEIIHNIKDMKRSVLKEEYDKQRLLVENDIILTLLKQINTDFRESELQKTSMMNEYEIMSDDFMKVKKENLELIEANRVLTIEVGKVSDLQSGFIELKEEYASKVDETRVLSNDISNLIEENRNLGLELDMLHEELEERKNIEENLNSELQERKNEFELWDAEATSFIFDLQISSTRDILFEHKVRELTEVCESLEGETAMKNLEIEEMKRKETAMEGEIESLRSQLMAYTPVIGSLKDNMTSLEKSFFGMANLIVLENRKSEDLDLKVHPDNHHLSDPNLMESPKSLKPSGISDLIDFQTRISALEKVIVEDMTVRRKSIEIDTKRKSVKEETEDPKRNKFEKLRGKRYLTLDNLNLTKPKPEISEARKGVPIRDIPLDQASDGSSSTNSRTRSRKGYLRTDNMMILDEMKPKKLPYEPQIEDLGVDKLEIPKTESGPIIIPNQETRKGKLLQRLSSDAQKLANLETTVKDLTKRLESGKKGKKGNGVDYETVKEQLEEAEESILRLVNVNVESAASIEKNPSLAAWVEQEGGWKESEKIKRVQVEVQKIQYVLMKLDEEKKGKGKSRFSRTKSRTSVILRDFIHRGSGRSAMGRRRRLCGCFTPSATKGDRIKM